VLPLAVSHSFFCYFKTYLAVRAAGTYEDSVDEYRCDYCGKRCKSAADLSKHFKQLHEREFKKKLSHK